jgi:hypothetical protein
MIRKYLLYITSLILLFIVILAIPGRDSFRMSAKDVLERVDSMEYIIAISQLEDLGERDRAVQVFIGDQASFHAATLPGAINLPLTDLSLLKIHESLSRSGTYILYSEALSTSCQVWVLLTQMGYKNVFVLDTD